MMYAILATLAFLAPHVNGGTTPSNMTLGLCQQFAQQHAPRPHSLPHSLPATPEAAFTYSLAKATRAAQAFRTRSQCSPWCVESGDVYRLELEVDVHEPGGELVTD